MARAFALVGWLSLGAMISGVVPTPRASGRASGREITIAATGDLLLHMRVIEAARAQRDAGGWGRVFEGFQRAMRPGDVGFANLETPLVDDEEPLVSATPPILGAPGDAAPALRASGIDVLACANNHAYDQRARGLARTVERVEAAGMRAVGAGRDEEAAWAPVVVTRGGLRVAFVAATQMLNRGPRGEPVVARVARFRSPTEVTDALARARARADLVVLAIHWSHDYWHGVAPFQRRWAAAWLDAGADLILGSGPHVLQAVERVTTPRGAGAVAYSLGNAISNQGNLVTTGRRRHGHPSRVLATTRDGVVLRASMRVRSGAVEVTGLDAVPLWTENNFLRVRARLDPHMDVRARLLSEVDHATRDERLPSIRAALGPAVEVR